MHEHLLALGRPERAERIERRVDDAALVGAPAPLPLVLDVALPPGRFVRQRAKAPGVLPEPRQQPDQDAERFFRGPLRQVCPRLAALDQHCPALVVAREQPHGPVAAPALERVGLLLGLPVGVDQLEDRPGPVRKVRRRGVAGGAERVGLADPEVPPRDALGGELRSARKPVRERQAGAGHR